MGSAVMASGEERGVRWQWAPTTCQSTDGEPSLHEVEMRFGSVIAGSTLAGRCSATPSVYRVWKIDSPAMDPDAEHISTDPVQRTHEVFRGTSEHDWGYERRQESLCEAEW
ncbi:hypothetical protein AcW2_005821 [Taiwanofungus camphoratus]|nr:hypothetical protein AcW2_005821 [Antrodia cinnamomea]